MHTILNDLSQRNESEYLTELVIVLALANGAVPPELLEAAEVERRKALMPASRCTQPAGRGRTTGATCPTRESRFTPAPNRLPPGIARDLIV